jgi:hypothetical protein
MSLGRPLEIQQQSTPHSDISRLICLARISNKYNFGRIEEWCTKVILEQCSSGLDFCADCSADDLDNLVSVAMCSGLTPLRDVIEDKWLERLDNGELDRQHAFQVGERYHWRSFLGKLYYRHVLEICSLEPAENTLAVELPSTFTDAQRFSLLKGFHSLTLFWQNFSKKKIEIQMQEGCRQGYHHNYYCVQAYSRVWEQLFGNVTSYKSIDVLGKLARMVEDTKGIQLWGTMQPGCRETISRGLVDLHAKVSETLPDHFLGPETLSTPAPKVVVLSTEAN